MKKRREDWKALTEVTVSNQASVVSSFGVIVTFTLFPQ